MFEVEASQDPRHTRKESPGSARIALVVVLSSGKCKIEGMVVAGPASSEVGIFPSLARELSLCLSPESPIKTFLPHLFLSRLKVGVGRGEAC